MLLLLFESTALPRWNNIETLKHEHNSHYYNLISWYICILNQLYHLIEFKFKFKSNYAWAYSNYFILYHEITNQYDRKTTCLQHFILPEYLIQYALSKSYLILYHIYNQSKKICYKYNQSLSFQRGLLLHAFLCHFIS